MSKVVCRNCNARLKLPEGYQKPTAKCPRCGTRNEIREADALPTSIANHDPISPPEPDDSWVIDTGDDPAGENVPSVSRLLKSWAGMLAALLDTGFKQYLTRRLIRWSWLMVLALSGLWIVFLIFVFVASWFPASGSAATSSTITDQSIESLLNGQGTPLTGLGELLAGSLSRSHQAPTFIQQVTGFGWRLLFFLTSLVGLVLTLIGCRVVLETIMVIFDISDCLQRIEKRDQ